MFITAKNKQKIIARAYQLISDSLRSQIEELCVSQRRQDQSDTGNICDSLTFHNKMSKKAERIHLLQETTTTQITL